MTLRFVAAFPQPVPAWMCLNSKNQGKTVTTVRGEYNAHRRCTRGSGRFLSLSFDSRERYFSLQLSKFESSAHCIKKLSRVVH